MANQVVGILGASSLVGGCLLSSNRVRDVAPHLKICAFSRRAVPADLTLGEGQDWYGLMEQDRWQLKETLDSWISLMPVWVLPDYFHLLERYGVRRVVALSSTSVFTKVDASDTQDREIANCLATGEERLIEWAESRGVDWIILRPTLIYGLGRDRNIMRVAGFIDRLGFFPLFGEAMGLRQPIHAEDVAMAALCALMQRDIRNRAYNISGGETLRYRDMIDHVFVALGKKPRYFPIPGLLLHFGAAWLRLLPGCKGLSAGMAERMNQDLVFDHSAAVRDFGFSPRPFQLTKKDLGG